MQTPEEEKFLNTKKELDLALHALSVVSGITKGGISHGI